MSGQTKGYAIESLVHWETVMGPRMEARIDALEAALRGLERAVAFMDKCRETPIMAAETGAFRDAHQWLEQAARAAVTVLKGD